MKRTTGSALLMLVAACTIGMAQSKHVPNLEFQSLTGSKEKIGDLRGSISVDNDPTSRKQRAKIEEFLTEQKPSMEIWVGADLDALQRCGLGEVLPGTMILDANGQVISRAEGQAHEEDITGPIDWVLNGEQGPEPAVAVKRY